VGPMDMALFLLRVIVGLLVAGHGAQKLLGWFGGPGLAGSLDGWTRWGFARPVSGQ
jgi:putative oxidoreductase